jgi:hypothetical protein
VWQVHNIALKASPPNTPRPNAQRVLVSPRLPELDGRKVRGACATACVAASLPVSERRACRADGSRETLAAAGCSAGIRPVAGQTSLSRVSITRDVPYKSEFMEWGDFVQTNPLPGGVMISTDWSSPADMQQARTIRERTDRLQKENAERVFAQESGRQGEEEPKLEKAFFHHTVKLQQQWDDKFLRFDEELASRRAKFELELQAEKEFLERELDTTLRQRRPKFSTETLSMMHGAEVLAKLHKYDEWQELHRRTEIRKAEETAKFDEHIRGRCDVRLSTLEAKHKKALKAFDDKFANERWKMVHERTKTFTELRQRYKNNLADMRSAHAREFIDLSARIPKTHVRPRTSYLNASSSFRGTHMCRDLQVQIQTERMSKAGLLLD